MHQGLFTSSGNTVMSGIDLNPVSIIKFQLTIAFILNIHKSENKILN